MGERPILFNGEMVRAILAGRKTETRRVVKASDEFPGRIDGYDTMPALLGTGEWGWLHDGCTEGIIGRCPYGAPGDRLLACAPIPGERDVYAAGSDGRIYSRARGSWQPLKPCWASRITLEVTEVRVERLQDIDADGARAEGCSDMAQAGAEQASVDLLALWWFHELWEKINAPRGFGWDTNPWVWVVRFRKVEA